MAVKKKTAKKAPGKKKTKARPAARKAAPAKKKAAPAKKSAKKSAKKPAPAAPPPKQVAAAKPAPKPTPKPVAAPAPRPTPAPSALASTGTITADEVVLGHVMALRPRIHVGFKPSAFGDAKRALVDARYATIEEAARAVAEKAVEISNESSRQDPFSRR